MPLYGIKRLFEKHSISVCGEKGSGKDLLTANVVVRRKLPYISNVDYPSKRKKNGLLCRFPLDLQALNTGNTYRNFLEQNLHRYIYPYPDKTDVYISDTGIYLPSQYCGQLDRDFSHFPTFEALSRHLGDCKVHTNTQDVMRVWNKAREQSNRYIRCIWAKVFFGVVFQYVIVYDRIDSCAARVTPCRVPRSGLFSNAESTMMRRTYIDNFRNQHGLVQGRLLIYRNLSNYDTRAYRVKLAKGGKED